MAVYLPIWAIATLALIVIVARRVLWGRKIDLDEPPLVRVSPWRFLAEGFHVLDNLAIENMGKSPHGIFTVGVLCWRIYVVNSPHVTTLIQARSKYTGLGWIAVSVMTSMGGHSRASKKLLLKGVERAEIGKGSGFIHDYHKLDLRALSQGSSLDAMKKDFSIAWKPFIDDLAKSTRTFGRQEIDIWEFLRRSITVSVGRGVWGTLSPFTTDPELWKPFWAFNLGYSFPKYICPWIFAREGAGAREKIVDAFVEYEESAGYEDASELARGRRNILERAGLDKQEIARMAMPQGFGQFDSSASVSFALLSCILRDSALLSRVRSEVEKVTTYSESGTSCVDVLRVESDCPLLISTFHEVLRFVAIGVTIRRVEQDYPLKIKTDGTEYRLRKGNILVASGAAIHTSSEFYEQAEKFIPERFLGVRCPEIQATHIFRGFGGGGNICLGRHFARTIVAGTVASLLMAFDFEESSEGGALCVPDRKDLKLGHITPNPKGNTKINIKIRKS